MIMSLPRNVNAILYYVCVHSNRLDKQHIPCHVVHVTGKLYRVCCRKGIIKRTFSNGDTDGNIPLHNWRVASKISLSEGVADPICVEACCCILSDSVTDITDLTQNSDSMTTTSDNWVHNSLYS